MYCNPSPVFVRLHGVGAAGSTCEATGLHAPKTLSLAGLAGSNSCGDGTPRPFPVLARRGASRVDLSAAIERYTHPQAFTGWQWQQYRLLCPPVRQRSLKHLYMRVLHLCSKIHVRMQGYWLAQSIGFAAGPQPWHARACPQLQ